MGWTPAGETQRAWADWESLVAEMATAVKDLKTAKAPKDDIDAAVKELLHRKEKFKAALEAAISAAKDDAEVELHKGAPEAEV